jgi:Ser/Thr protein kinase RdoA (MazF antagonist)
LTEALKRYGIAKRDTHLLDGFESFIYEYEKGDQGYILRISHSSRRTPDLIQGEIEWLNYLADNGVPAVRAIPSDRGNLVESIDLGSGAYFTTVSFERARGDHPRQGDWDNGLAAKLGQTMGRMHALTKRFEPSQPRFRRPEWYEEYETDEGYAEKYLPPAETVVIDKFKTLLEYLYTLPKEHDSYGLVHVDMHGGNFFVDHGQITLFDFDDCMYTWFIYDMAMALFYAISHHCVDQQDIIWASRFLEQFLAGYRRENMINPKWLGQIPYFLKLREIDLYIIIHRSCDLDDLDPWCASFMANRKYKIENDIPYLKLDWDEYV